MAVSVSVPGNRLNVISPNRQTKAQPLGYWEPVTVDVYLRFLINSWHITLFYFIVQIAGSNTFIQHPFSILNFIKKMSQITCPFLVYRKMYGITKKFNKGLLLILCLKLLNQQFLPPPFYNMVANFISYLWQHQQLNVIVYMISRLSYK